MGSLDAALDAAGLFIQKPQAGCRCVRDDRPFCKNGQRGRNRSTDGGRCSVWSGFDWSFLEYAAKTESDSINKIC